MLCSTCSLLVSCFILSEKESKVIVTIFPSFDQLMVLIYSSVIECLLIMNLPANFMSGGILK